jgi:MFS family permease
LPIVLATSLSVLVGCRMLLGAAGGAGTATSMNVCHEWFPDNRRALPGALMIMGGTIGSMLGAPALTYIIFEWGWRYAFLVCSVLGLLVMGGWLLVSRNGPWSAHHSPGQAERGSAAVLRRLLRDQTIIGNVVVGLCAYWIVGFMVAWLAPYVRDQGGLSPMSSGWVLSLIFLGQSVIVVAVAALSQRLLAAGHSSRFARSYALVGCLLGSAACFVGMAFIADATTRMFLVMLATALAAAVFPLSAAMITEVAPGTERYRLMTIIFAILTLSGLVSPGATGVLVELGATHGWRPALLLTAAVGLFGGLLGLRLLHPATTIATFRNTGSV